MRFRTLIWVCCEKTSWGTPTSRDFIQPVHPFNTDDLRHERSQGPLCWYADGDIWSDRADMRTDMGLQAVYATVQVYLWRYLDTLKYHLYIFVSQRYVTDQIDYTMSLNPTRHLERHGMSHFARHPAQWIHGVYAKSHKRRWNAMTLWQW